MLLMHGQELPENAPRHSIWLPRLQRERQAKLGEFARPYVGRYNIVGRRACWQNRDFDGVLREHGYVPPPARHPTTSARSTPTPTRSRSSSSDGHSAARSAPYPPPARRSTGVVIRDAAWSSSAPPRREKKEEPEEEWEQIPPALLQETRPWWG
jgi:hypothetical protein